MTMKERMTPYELSVEWNTKINKIYIWVNDGMPHYNLNGKMYLDLKECQNWFAGGWLKNRAI